MRLHLGYKLALASLVFCTGVLFFSVSTKSATSLFKAPPSCSWNEYVRSFAVERNVEIDDGDHADETFRCPVCGSRTTGSFTENLRETGACRRCGATNRLRQMSLVINGLISAASSEPVTCMNCSYSRIEGYAIYNTQCSGALHNILKKVPQYKCSEYFGKHVKQGGRIKGIRNEDLQQLTFVDEMFDIVISTEVFEHIPEPYQAHSEVFRVLKPGGCHVFSVPFIPQNENDTAIASLGQDGEITWASEPMYHPDPIRREGVPVFNIFGIETMYKLCEIGFEMSHFRFHSLTAGILGNNAYVFLACKKI